jgi:hypothetical protein
LGLDDICAKIFGGSNRVTDQLCVRGIIVGFHVLVVLVDGDLLAAIALAGGSSKPCLVGAAGLEPATNRL